MPAGRSVCLPFGQMDSCALGSQGLQNERVRKARQTGCFMAPEVTASLVLSAADAAFFLGSCSLRHARHVLCSRPVRTASLDAGTGGIAGICSVRVAMLEWVFSEGEKR